MKIVYVSFGYIRYDGRGRELIKVAKELGETTYITRGEDDELPLEPSHFVYHGNYAGFIRYCVNIARKMKGMDVIFIDNRKGIIPGYLMKKISNARYVIQDCRELYDMTSAVGVLGRIGCFIEHVFTKHADVVIAANAFRAKVMKKSFHLKKVPLNYENLRKLEYSTSERERELEKECGSFFEDKKFRVVSTAGCDMTRTTGSMIHAIKELGDEYELLIIGKPFQDGEEVVERMVKELGLTNVKVFPQMDQDHLKYFIDHCQIGLVTYHQNDLNNKYCASGKIFEFLFDGIPVVTSTNPPLKEFCQKYKVGIANDNYARAIREIAVHYDQWKTQVEKYIVTADVEENNHRLAEQIRKELGEQFS